MLIYVVQWNVYFCQMQDITNKSNTLSFHRDDA